MTATAAALLRAGALTCDHRIILGDGLLPAHQPGWAAQEVLPWRGVRGMLWAVFELAVRLGTDRLVFCEDDVAPCAHAIDFALRVPIADNIAFVDLHDLKELASGHAPGLYPIPCMGLDGRGYWGNQCMVFPRRTLQWLITQDPRKAPWRKPSHGDCALGWALRRSPWPRYAAHLPRLVRHTGQVSAAHLAAPFTDVRVTRDYPGDDFDARSLLSDPRP